MKLKTKIGIGLAVAVLLPTIAMIDFYVPSTEVMHVTGTNVIRVDDTGHDDTAPTTRDVYEIYADDLDGRSHVFVNEDFGLFLKFDSASVQARATSIAANKGLAAVRTIGWRIPLLSMIPNALDVHAVDASYKPLPIGKAITYGLLFCILAALFLTAQRAIKRRRAQVAERQAAAEAARQASIDAQPGSEKAVQDFIAGGSK